MITPQEITARFIDPWLDRLALPPAWVLRVFYIQLGYQVAGKWKIGRVRFFTTVEDDTGLFRNGILFVRFMLPFFISLQIRWAGSNPNKREYLQTYIGWKFNGYFSAVFRVQSDASAAAGFTSPNFNQAVGWADGRK